MKIISIFKSIDGEAYHSGKATLFLRTFGCNLLCKYCDTKESLNKTYYTDVYGEKPLQDLTPDEAYWACRELNPDGAINHITITGGEPLLPNNQDWMRQFAHKMLLSGYEVDFETNGAVDYTDILAWRHTLGEMGRHMHLIMDWKCPGSGMNRYMDAHNLELLDSDLDVVKCVCKDDDFEEVARILPLLQSHSTSRQIPLYISPCWGDVDCKKLADFVLAHPNNDIRVQFQIHKLIYGAEDRFH